MRFAFSVVLALSVGIGAYFGSARVASSAKVPPRMVLLRMGDIAAVGRSGPRAQCQATSESRSDPYRYAWLRCSPGPLSQATYTVVLAARGLAVFQKGVLDPVWSSP
jgi:hypothetical protein